MEDSKVHEHDNSGFVWWVFLSLFILLPPIFPQAAFSLKIACFAIGMISLAILVTGIFIIPNDPPHFGVITKWGERLWKNNGSVVVYAKEGWNWVFLRGFMYGVKTINKSKREIDFPAYVITTHDMVTTEVPSSLAYELDPKNIIHFLNLGTDDPWAVLEDMIADIWEERMRTWSRSTEGPQTWEKLQDSDEEGIRLLLRELMGDAEVSATDLSKIRRGNGKWSIPQFGIFLKRANLGTMKPFGKVYEASLLKKTEKKEGEAEIYEQDVDLKKAEKLKAKFKAKDGKDVSIEDCYKIVLEAKIRREANKFQSLSAVAESLGFGGGKTKGGKS